MLRKFCVSRGSRMINLVDYDHETEHFFVTKRQGPNLRGLSMHIKIGKDPLRKSYFDTWKEAHDEVKRQLVQALARAESLVKSLAQDIVEMDKDVEPKYRPPGER